MRSLAIERLETALQARKFDHTLAKSWAVGSASRERERRVTSTGIAALDCALEGGWERGEVSEVVGGVSSGRLGVMLAALSGATRRGEVVAVVDALDSFDPASAAAAGVDLERVLWVRGPALSVGRLPGSDGLSVAVNRAVRALDLIVRAGGFAVVALDVADVASRWLRALPLATWMRIAHVNEGRDTACLLVGEAPMGRSARGVSVRLVSSGRWTGESAQSRRFAGFDVRAEIMSARGQESRESAMFRIQKDPMPLMCCLVPETPCVPVPGALEAVARACSPRVAVQGEGAVVFDASGLGRVLGPPAVIAGEVARLAAERGVRARIAIAGTATAATLLARARPGITIVEPGEDAVALASLPLEWLFASSGEAPSAQPARGKGRRHGRAGHYRLAPGPLGSKGELRTSKLIEILHAWGLSTLGDLARLPRGDVHARLGAIGVHLQQSACGEDAAPIVPAAEAPRFVERIALEWPIEGLEPLSFVLARQCEALSIALERADRGAVTLTTTLRLTTRTTHTRVLHLPAPMRDARVLRTLILLDLESHPPPAAIDVVDLELGVTPGRIAHGALFARTLPSPEDLATLVARLGALMGETRIGAPAEVDTHDARAVTMTAFRLPDQGRRQKAQGRSEVGAGADQLFLERENSWPASERSSLLPSAFCLLPFIRRYRLPIAASVALERGRPVSISPSARALAGGRVVACAGPWRSSGAWWTLDRRGWDRDEWDVQLADGAIYRLASDRETGQWVVEGTVD